MWSLKGHVNNTVQFVQSDPCKFVCDQKGVFTVIAYPPISRQNDQVHESDSCSKYYWEIELTKIRGIVHIGCVTSKFKNYETFTSKLIGDNAQSWAIDSSSGSIGHNQNWKSYGEKVSRSERVGILIDVTNGTLEFILSNHKRYGVAFDSLPKDVAFYPAVSFRYKTAMTLIIPPNKWKFLKPDEAKSITTVSKHRIKYEFNRAADRELINQQSSDLHRLPEEILQHILSFVPPKYLFNVTSVCRLTRRILDDSIVWDRKDAPIDRSYKKGLLKSKDVYRIRRNWSKQIFDSYVDTYCTGDIRSLSFSESNMAVGIYENIDFYELGDKDEPAIHVGSFVGHTSYVNDVIICDPIMISCSRDKTVRCWSMETGLMTQILTGHQQEVTCISYPTKSNHVVSGSADESSILWDIEVGEVCRFSFAPSTISGGQRWTAVQYVPEKNLVVGGTEKCVVLWDTRSGTEITSYHRSVRAEKGSHQLYDPTNQQILVSGCGSLTLYDLRKSWKYICATHINCTKLKEKFGILITEAPASLRVWDKAAAGGTWEKLLTSTDKTISYDIFYGTLGANAWDFSFEYLRIGISSRIRTKYFNANRLSDGFIDFYLSKSDSYVEQQR